MYSRSNIPPNSYDDSNSNPVEQFLRHVSGQEKELDVITCDHSYAKNWNSNPDANHVKPVRMLFMKGFCKQTHTIPVGDTDIDVEAISSDVVQPFDNAKVRVLLDDCDQFLRTYMSNKFEEGVGEEEPSKVGWNKAQNSLYKQTMKVLQGSRLSRLTTTGTIKEALHRRISIDKGARRLRQLFSSYLWDMDLLCWLHHTLMGHLNASLLAEYLEMLRTLKLKVPVIIDRLLAYVASSPSNISSISEAMNLLLKKSWDPLCNQYNKPKKLSGSPLILIVPNGPHQTLASQSQRMRFWSSQLSSLGKVVYPPFHLTGASHGLATENCVNHVYTSVRNKVAELKTNSPHRPIVLLGWTIGALIASHVALVESVSAVICLGFPLTGVTDSRGDLDDPLLSSKVPTLYVIGQHSNICSMDDVEDFRERMKAETGLVVVGGTDDMLRISVTKKRIEGITQAMVDKCVIDEVEEFLSSVLSPHLSFSSTHHAINKKVIGTVMPIEQPQGDDTKRKRRRPREYSPDILPAKKKLIQSPRQTTQKISTSSSSSETSSSGSYATAVQEQAKLKPSPRKVGRPPSLSRKQQILKQPVKSVRITNPEVPTYPDEKQISSEPEKMHEPETTPITTTPLKPTLGSSKLNPLRALALANQQKNVPVDVVKAFGRDSSFLPRPLTPAEFETTSNNPTEKIATPATQEASTKTESTTAVVQNTVPPVIHISNKSTFVGLPLTNILGSSGSQQGISYVRVSAANEVPTVTTFTTHIKPISTVKTSQIVSKITETIDADKVCVVQKLKLPEVSVSAAGVNPQTKLFSSPNITLSQMKTVLTSKTSLTSLASHGQTVLVTPASGTKPATYIVASNDSNAPPGKKMQFRRMLVQGGSCVESGLRLPILSTLKSSSVASATKEETKSYVQLEGTTDQQACNLSLLSDVAGMKEPMIKKSEFMLNSMSSSANLVKLSSATTLSKIMERPSPNQIRRIRIVDPVSSSTQRHETPEEQAEKQMAIRALSSLDKEGESANINVGFAKPDTHLVNRQSPMVGYSVLMPRSGISMMTRPPQYRRGRGRGLFTDPGIRRPRIQRFYPF